MYAIIRTAKLKHWGSIGGSGGHTYRQDGLAPNADPSRLHLNRTLVGTPGEVVSDTRRRVNAVTDSPRANAVLALELFLGASPTWFHGKSEREIQTWANRNIAWLKQRYGASNVVHAVLHRDESTPHIVAYVVPEVDGRLNARAVVGGRGKLAGLQSAYAAAMAPFGLQRGVAGSKARHTPVKRFYGQMNQAATDAVAEVRALGEPTPLPDIPLLASKKVRGEAWEAWRAQERGRTEKLVEKVTGAFLAASVAVQQAEQLREENGKAMSDVQDLRIKLSEAYEQLGLSKDQVGLLRRLDVSLVAQRLGHMGEVRPKENAIDLVRRVNGFDFGQAVAWLHHELGAMHTGALVAAALQDHEPARPFTPAENVMKRAIAQQTDALGCDRYRITLVPADESKKPYLPGKSHGAASEERFYSRSDLTELIPWLRYKNNQGDNVYITPMDDNAFYILLDDLRMPVEELTRRGFQPCLVQRTSWEKEQVVFKVPKDLPRRVVMDVFNDLNRRVGDPEMTGLRHPLRLAGFRNMKPKHLRDGQRPFVEVSSGVNRFCERCIALVQSAIAKSELLSVHHHR